MSTNLEIEFKADLSKEDYESLISNFDKSKIYRQINYYIDDDNLSIRGKKCGLRIREKDGNFELTLKVPEIVGKTEINQQISNKIYENFAKHNVFPSGEIKEYLEQKLSVKTTTIHILGELITDRLDIKYKTSLISIDKSTYNSKTDYEIECEDSSLESAKTNLLEFLKKYHINYKESHGTKLRRFIESL